MMVLDNRVYNEADPGLDRNEADVDTNLNQEIEHLDLEERVLDEARESGEIHTVMDMRRAFAHLLEQAPKSSSAADLLMLYGQAGNLIKLLDTPAFQDRVGGEIDEIRNVAKEDFAKVARELNRQAEVVGARPHFAEKWGG